MRTAGKVLGRCKVSLAVPDTGGNWLNPKPFSEAPGPRVVPFLGSSWRYFPFIGNWDVNKLHVAGALKLAEFGPIVREEVSPSLTLCHVFKAEDIELVYKSEGRFPARRSHLAIAHYRQERPHLYNTGGLLPTNGDEWYRLRSAFQKHISPLQDVRSFLPTANEIISDFVEKCINNNTVIDDFLPLVSRLYLELMWMYMFGKRLGSFESDQMTKESISSKLIEAAEVVNLSTIQTDSSEKIWKIVKTPLYRKVEGYLQFIESVVLEELERLTDEKAGQKKNKDDSFLIEKYLQNPQVNRKDINGMVVDLLLGSVDTTSYSTSFLFYNLSGNCEAQEKLRKEAEELLPRQDSTVTSTVLNKATYTRAILKESFRLNPIAIGVSRYLPKDTLFSGYLVPRGTLMMTQNLVACRCEDYFPRAETFIPERWVRGSPEYSSSSSPFLILPFSHGPRTCIARRIAEQNILTLLLTVGRKYSIEWHGGELGIVTPLICKPDGPVRLQFNTWPN